MSVLKSLPRKSAPQAEAGCNQQTPLQGTSLAGHGLRWLGEGTTVSPRLIIWRGECLTQERWHLWAGTQHWDHGSCLISSLLEATQPNLSLYDSSLLWAVFHLLEPRVSGHEWDFFVLALLEGEWVSRRLPSYPGRWNPHWFSQPDIMWTPLPRTSSLG